LAEIGPEMTASLVLALWTTYIFGVFCVIVLFSYTSGWLTTARLMTFSETYVVQLGRKLILGEV